MRTLTCFTLALGAAFAVGATAQVPAPAAPPSPRTPRATPAPPAMPAPPPAAAPAATAPRGWSIDLDEHRWALEDRRVAIAEAQVAMTEAREHIAMARVDMDAARIEHGFGAFAALAPLAAMEPLEPTHVDAGAWAVDAAHVGTRALGISSVPRQGWAAQDPADSLYRTARETLNRQEYRRAAELFRQVRERHPRSVYAPDAAYWQAFALYRVGTTDDLRAARQVLQAQTGTYSAKQLANDAVALRARVNGALARRGDQDAVRTVESEARNGSVTCDTEDLEVRTEALNALTQLDQSAAVPLLRKVLERRDDCSAQLRRSAVMLLARRADAGALALLGEVVMRDPSSSVRSSAITHINQVPSDEATAVLESLLRSDDESIRRSAARTLARRDGTRARRAVRGYLDSPQTSESQKAELIHGYARENTTADDVQHLRALYARTDSDRIRSAILGTIQRVAPEEGRSWLLSIARNPNEAPSSRSAAISYVSRDASLPVAELARVYDAANERRIREQLVGALGRRTESEAADKLIDIVKNSTDPVVRRSAINQLTQRKDPRLPAVLQELIDR